ncbi:hypothetical protein HPP92_013150 [Vanilla planifolia]|uniref:Uncharacterized protein n=1 Tax=Vanilla planifolia TaxID=51239 RepID=A0A835QRT3_VANPL|nr:hypothetical protein HPP92_013150 [Vanilla planifolia]
MMTTALELRSMQVADLVLEKFLDYQTGHSYSLVDLAGSPGPTRAPKTLTSNVQRFGVL